MLREGPTIIGIGGFESNVGKTTLMCDLLKAFPGWEAIKTTRGHYRSCGKDSQACCVSHLLRDEPIVRSGREETYAVGKDTGRYWEAGAANVHWVIATEDQVAEGIKAALKRVVSGGVFVEGNSFSEFVDVGLMAIVTNADQKKIKKSAKRALSKATLVYLTSEKGPETREQLVKALGSIGGAFSRGLPIYGPQDFDQLVAEVRELAWLSP